ncbi:MAG: restriction endonuclease subunit S [Sulfuritalea sp.]|nr:restriction endonuclease subunit S [Sulfuritalea sp.]
MSGPHLHVAEISASYQVIKNIESIGWPTVPLSEAVEINPKADRSLLTDDTEVTFVPMAAVEATSGRVDTSTVRRYEEVKKGYTHFRDGDVLFAKITPCMENGKMAVAHSLRNGIGLGSTEFHVLRPREGVNPHYVYYFVSSRGYRSEAAHHMTGAVGQKRVPVSFLEQSEIPLPSPTEQRRIVAEIEKQFSRLDEAVAGLKRVKSNLKRYKAAILKAAVEGRLVPTEADLARREGRDYETGPQLLQRILETRRSLWQGRGKYKEPVAPDTTDLPELPEGWVWANCDFVVSRIEAGASFKCTERPPENEETGVLKVSAVTWGSFDESESKTCNDPERIEEGYLVRAGDFLFSRANTIDLVGACVIVQHISKRLMLSDKTLRFSVTSQVRAEWLLICLRSKLGRDEIERLATGNQESMRNIGQERIRQIRLPLPPIPEQHRIVAEVDRLLSIAREAEQEITRNLERALALRQSILQKAFSTSVK